MQLKYILIQIYEVSLWIIYYYQHTDLDETETSASVKESSQSRRVHSGPKERTKDREEQTKGKEEREVTEVKNKSKEHKEAPAGQKRFLIIH